MIHPTNSAPQFLEHDDCTHDGFRYTNEKPPSWPAMPDSDRTTRTECSSEWPKCRKLDSTDSAKYPNRSARHCKYWDGTFSSENELAVLCWDSPR